ncbi:unnamed protein product, partial [Polarella glacialis]
GIPATGSLPSAQTTLVSRVCSSASSPAGRRSGPGKVWRASAAVAALASAGRLGSRRRHWPCHSCNPLALTQRSHRGISRTVAISSWSLPGAEGRESENNINNYKRNNNNNKSNNKSNNNITSGAEATSRGGNPALQTGPRIWQLPKALLRWARSLVQRLGFQVSGTRGLPSKPELLWAQQGSSEPWGEIDTCGWTWSSQFSDEENLLNLAYAASLNTVRFQRGLAVGKFGAVLCRPTWSAATRPGEVPRMQQIEILGLGMNYPPRLTAPGEVEGPDTALALTGSRASTLHAEVMLVSRCAREGVASEGTWMFCFQPPCWECIKALLMAGVAHIIFQMPDDHDSFARQREVVAASRAEWRYVPVSTKRAEYLQHLREDPSDCRNLISSSAHPIDPVSGLGVAAAIASAARRMNWQPVVGASAGERSRGTITKVPVAGGAPERRCVRMARETAKQAQTSAARIFAVKRSQTSLITCETVVAPGAKWLPIGSRCGDTPPEDPHDSSSALEMLRAAVREIPHLRGSIANHMSQRLLQFCPAESRQVLKLDELVGSIAPLQQSSQQPVQFYPLQQSLQQPVQPTYFVHHVAPIALHSQGSELLNCQAVFPTFDGGSFSFAPASPDSGKVGRCSNVVPASPEKVGTCTDVIPASPERSTSDSINQEALLRCLLTADSPEKEDSQAATALRNLLSPMQVQDQHIVARCSSDMDELSPATYKIPSVKEPPLTRRSQNG